MTVVGQFQIKRGIPAAADLSAHQYKVVFLTSGTIQVPAAAQGDGADVIGVLQDKPEAAGRVGEVVVMGFTKAIAGEAIAVGENLMVEGSDVAAEAGRVLVATENGTTEGSEFIIGKALQAASAANEVIEIFVDCVPCAVANRTG